MDTGGSEDIENASATKEQQSLPTSRGRDKADMTIATATSMITTSSASTFEPHMPYQRYGSNLVPQRRASTTGSNCDAAEPVDSRTVAASTSTGSMRSLSGAVDTGDSSKCVQHSRSGRRPSASDIAATKKFAVPFRYFSVAFSALFMALAVSVMWLLGLYLSETAITGTIDSVGDDIESGLANALDSSADKPMLCALANRNLVFAQNFTADTLEFVRPILLAQSQSYVYAPVIYMGFANGGFIGYNRDLTRMRLMKQADNNQSLVIAEVNRMTGSLIPNAPNETYAGYDCRERDWYKGAIVAAVGSALGKESVYVSNVYAYGDGMLGITVSVAIRSLADGSVMGVSAVDLPIEALQALFRLQTVSTNGRAFLVDRTGRVLAVNVADPTGTILTDAGNAKDWQVQTASKTLSGEGKSWQTITECTSWQAKSVEGQDATFFSKVSLYVNACPLGKSASFKVTRTLTGDSNMSQRFILVTTVPLSDFAAFFERLNTISGSVFAGIVVLFASVSGVLNYLLALPLKRLKTALRSASTLHFERALKKVGSPSRFTEIRGIQVGFVGLVAAIESFTKYVPEERVQSIVQQGQVAELGLEPRRAVIMFVDIEGFTTLCATMDLTVVVHTVMEALDGITEIVLAHDGILDKYIGDACVAIWPNTSAEYCDDACRAAISIQRFLDCAQTTWRQRNLPAIRCRVGMAEGEALIGNFGSRNRLSYTAIGNCVNLAARLEPLNKTYGTRILVDASLYAKAMCNDSEYYIFRFMDVSRIKGLELPCRVYEMVDIGPSGCCTEISQTPDTASRVELAAVDVRNCVSMWNHAMALYATHQLDNAAKEFDIIAQGGGKYASTAAEMAGKVRSAMAQCE